MSIPAPTTPNPATATPKLRIKELRLQNYRAFRNARLVFDDVTFLVGRNGAGKSTLMDAMAFVAETMRDSLSTAVERRGNFQGVLHANGKRPLMSIRVAVVCKLSNPGGWSPTLLYGFELGRYSYNSAYHVSKEVWKISKRHYMATQDMDNTSDIWNARNYLREGLVFPLLEHTFTIWDNVHVALKQATLCQFASLLLQSEPGIGSDRRLDRFGANIGDILRSTAEDDRSWVEQRLRAIAPSLRGVSATARAGRRVIEFLQDAGGGETATFDASMMSNGTLRSLGILLALRQNPRPSIVMVDEIEDSLHPFAQSVLLEAIEEMSVEFPVVVSTHNPEVLSHPSARPERVRIIQWNDGASEIRHLSKKVIEELQPPDTVGDLLRSNALWTEDEPSTCPEGDAFFEV